MKTEDGGGEVDEWAAGTHGYRWTENSYLILMIHFEIDLEFYGENGT